MDHSPHPDSSVSLGDDSASLLAGLDQTQAEAVASEANPLAILAGAGSGKTRVLTRRIAHRVTSDGVDPRRTMAVTFTRKAASELRHRLRGLGLRDEITCGTFHSLAYSQLHERWAERGIRPPEILDRKFGLIANLLGRRADQTLIRDTLAELEWIVARDLRLERYEAEADRAGRTSPLPIPDLINLAQRFAELKRSRRLVDFDDLLLLAIRDIEADDDYAGVIRWRHRHVFVDEFQDVNPLQFRLLKAWTGPSPDLCVVGDPNQAIYGWNGADSWYLRRFTKFFPAAQVVQLGHNYRSTPEIIEAGHSVLPKPDREAPRPQTDRPAGDEITIRSHVDDEAEAQAVARALRDNHAPGTGWSNQAVLVRTNAQVAVIATALERAKIPHRVRGGGQLVDQPEIKPLLAMLRGVTAPLAESLDDLASAIAEAGERRGGSPGRDGSRRAGANDGYGDGYEDNGEESYADEGYGEEGDGSRPGSAAPSAAEAERHRNRQALLRLATDHAASFQTASGADFASWLTATARRDAIDVANDAVDVMTFHAAKGLEWHVVHLAGIESGYVPVAGARGPAALSEERRLLHVAITRAHDKVIANWARSRTLGRRSVKRNRSPYLDHIDPQAEPTAGTSGATGGERRSRPESGRDRAKRHLTQMRADLDPTEPASPLYNDLVAWRRETAREQGVPAYIVFNNRTLAAIAAAQPATVDELLEVPGIGPTKAERYGTDLINMINTR